MAALPDDPRGMTITITDSKGKAWTTTITEVLERSRKHIVVRNSGRPASG